MKKLLGIVVLGLLLGGNAYASCYDDMDYSWKFSNYLGNEVAEFHAVNNSNSPMKILSFELLTSNKEVIKKKSLNNELRAFGKLTLTYDQQMSIKLGSGPGIDTNYIPAISLHDVNRSFVKYARVTCSR